MEIPNKNTNIPGIPLVEIHHNKSKVFDFTNHVLRESEMLVGVFVDVVDGCD
jgi:hypothetical protein